MILTTATRAFGDLFSAPIRGVFWKVIGLTLLFLVALWYALRLLFLDYALPYVEGWLPDMGSWSGGFDAVVGLLSALVIAFAMAFLIAPVSAIIAGLFLDDAADSVEQASYPGDAPGQALPLGQSILSSLRFFLVVIAANLVALIFLLVPGVNLVIFFVVNGYLLGREYFEFAAARYLGPERARAWRSRNQGRVWLAGLAIGLFLMVPLLNLLTPLFAAIFMIHYVKALMRQEAGQPIAQGAR
ncbi:sulfate transporter family protein [Rhizobium sp.]